MSTAAPLAEPRTRTLMGVQILGSGRYVPEQVVTNHDLLETHGFDPDRWPADVRGALWS